MSHNNSDWFLYSNVWGTFIWLIIFALIIWVIILLFSQRKFPQRKFSQRKFSQRKPSQRKHKASEDKKLALKALDELFAKGEIDEAEYLRRKASLNNKSNGLL